MNNDDVILPCADLTALQSKLEYETSIRIKTLDVSAIASTNQWVGCDRGLGVLYEPFWNEYVAKREGVNLIECKWPSRERHHDVGSCLALLNSLGISVNHVIPEGGRMDDIRDTLASQANVLWCP